MVSKRLVLQKIREFARRERREKEVEVRVRKTKLTTFMRRGRLPDFRMRKVVGAEYLVECRKGNEVRVYFFDGSGRLLVAESFEPGAPELRMLLDSSRQLPL